MRYYEALLEFDINKLSNPKTKRRMATQIGRERARDAIIKRKVQGITVDFKPRKKTVRERIRRKAATARFKVGRAVREVPKQLHAANVQTQRAARKRLPKPSVKTLRKMGKTRKLLRRGVNVALDVAGRSSDPLGRPGVGMTTGLTVGHAVGGVPGAIAGEKVSQLAQGEAGKNVLFRSRRKTMGGEQGTSRIFPKLRGGSKGAKLRRAKHVEKAGQAMADFHSRSRVKDTSMLGTKAPLKRFASLAKGKIRNIINPFSKLIR